MASLQIPLYRDFSTTTDYLGIYNEIKVGLNPRIVSFQPPSKSSNLAEFAIYSRAPTLEYTNDAVTLEVLGYMNQQAYDSKSLHVGFGWGPEENFVDTLGKYSTYVHASDWAKNLATLSNVEVDISQRQEFLGVKLFFTKKMKGTCL